MKIPPITLPSDAGTKIYMRDATVAEMIDYSGILPEYEEQLKTQFLNTVQLPEHFSDSKEWSIHDRAYVLYWHWIHTRQSTTFNLPYDCNHCGEKHNFFFEMKKLFSSHYIPMRGKSFREITISDRKVHVSILNGEACETLEHFYHELEILKQQGKADTELFRRKKTDVLVDEYALMCSFPAKEASIDAEAKDYKQKLYDVRREVINSLSSTEFLELARKVKEAEEDLAHGIASLRNGVKLLWQAEPHPCENKKEEGLSTTVLFPFRADSYVPRIH